jgi:nucleoid-associated protein YgaU
MPNDAKLALVIGVGLVVAVAVVFFHKDLVAGHLPDGKPPASVVNPPGASPAEPANTPSRRVAGRSTSLAHDAAAPREHTVVEGETLYELAEHYYGDGERFVDLYRSNRAVVKRPDRLEAGTVLVIPDLPEAPAVEGERGRVSAP